MCYTENLLPAPPSLDATCEVQDLLECQAVRLCADSALPRPFHGCQMRTSRILALQFCAKFSQQID